MSWPGWVAAGAAAVLLLGWLGYPLALALLARLRRRERGPDPAARSPDRVSVVIATREPPEIIRDRLLNVRACRRAAEQLEIVVGVDCRAPYPIEAYRTSCGELGSFVQGDQPGGKASTLNAAVRASGEPILVFTDSQQRFEAGAIQELLARFADASVGCVTGTYEFGHGASPHGLLRQFWAYELMLRELESELDSVVAVTGAIYALRRELWTALPAGVICDDLYVPMQVVRQGKRVVAESRSLAYDDRSFSRAQEFGRKVRTLTGMIQFCLLCPWALVPTRNRIWGQFVCHKLLRLATPYLLLVALGTLGLLLGRHGPAWLWPPLGLSLLGVVALLVLAPRESALRRLRGHLTWAGYLLVAPLVATTNAIRGKWEVWGFPLKPAENPVRGAR